MPVLLGKPLFDNYCEFFSSLLLKDCSLGSMSDYLRLWFHDIIEYESELIQATEPGDRKIDNIRDTKRSGK